MRNRVKIYAACSGLLPVTGQAVADSAMEMAKKMQDPLANIAAVMTDNDILFETGDDETSYSFQLQPVKAWSFDEQGFNFIARASIPYMGMAPESQKPNVDDPLPAGGDHTWGFGDIVTQFYFSPKSEDPWKWGAGPIISWKTRTNDNLAGAGWGGGVSGVLVGNLSENVSSAFIANQLWGDGGFNTSSIQPMIFYNVPSMPGVTLQYNATTSYAWNASSGNEWTVPLGVGVSKMFDMGSGYGIETGIGYYNNMVKPDGAADWKINWTVNFLLP